MKEAMGWKHLYGILKCGVMTVKNNLWTVTAGGFANRLTKM